jgi:hypothetical protein
MDLTAFSSLAFAALGLPAPVGKDAASETDLDARQTAKALTEPSARTRKKMFLGLMAVLRYLLPRRRTRAP